LRAPLGRPLPDYYDTMKNFWVIMADKFEYEVPSSLDNDCIRKKIEYSFMVLGNHEQYKALHNSITKNPKPYLKNFFMKIGSYKKYNDSQENPQNAPNNNAN